jgi:hypothetical protein
MILLRRILLIPVLCAIWMGLCAWAAGVPWSSRWSAREHLQMPGRDFQIRLGKSAGNDGGLSVGALGEDGTALETMQLGRVRTKEYPVLRYRISDFPDTLEFALIFRRRDAPNDVQTISLPSPGNMEVAVDLSRFEQWRGEITEFGFAQYAAAQLVPPSAAASFPPFRIEYAQLQAPSWGDVFPRLASDWFGYRPWSLQSINAIGPGRGTLAHSWMLPVVASGVLLSWLAAWLVLGWTRARALKAACIVSIAAWIVFDLRWLDELVAKHAVTEHVYAGKPWSERLMLQPDEATLAAAKEIAKIAAEQHAQRVLVHADSLYTALRLIYFLLPLNTAPLEQTMYQAPGVALPDDALIVVYSSEWKYDEESRQLGDGKIAIPAEKVYARGDLRVFRSGRVAP